MDGREREREVRGGGGARLSHFTVWSAAGGGPTAPDFHLWEMIDQHAMLAADHSLPDPLAAKPAREDLCTNTVPACSWPFRLQGSPPLSGCAEGPLKKTALLVCSLCVLRPFQGIATAARLLPRQVCKFGGGGGGGGWCIVR